MSRKDYRFAAKSREAGGPWRISGITELKRVTIFAKGNLDVRDTLHSCFLGGKLVWNGINEVLRQRGSELHARVIHETWTRSDALLESNGKIPSIIVERNLPLGPYSIESQFSRRVMQSNADIVVLSIQPDITMKLIRHREEGFLFYPYDWQSWDPEAQHWLRQAFYPIGLLELEEFKSNFEAIITNIRENSSAQIIIYNLSSVNPGDQIHNYQASPEAISTRIRRFNLGLVDLSERTGVSIIDVDHILAREGTNTTKFGALHFTPAGCRAVAEEFLRVVQQRLCLN